jgi:hypothetical protein
MAGAGLKKCSPTSRRLDPDRGGVGRKHRPRVYTCLERGEHRALDLRALDNRLDDKPRRGKSGRVGRDRETPHQLVDGEGGERAARDPGRERIGQPRGGAGARLRCGVRRNDLVARLQKDLCDAHTHRPEADNADHIHPPIPSAAQPVRRLSRIRCGYS